jgi:hypothetical protein
LALLALLSATCVASAYNDPGVQRWMHCQRPADSDNPLVLPG